MRGARGQQEQEGLGKRKQLSRLRDEQKSVRQGRGPGRWAGGGDLGGQLCARQGTDVTAEESRARPVQRLVELPAREPVARVASRTCARASGRAPARAVEGGKSWKAGQGVGEGPRGETAVKQQTGQGLVADGWEIQDGAGPGQE